MANPSTPFGFKPLMTTLSGIPVRVGEYAKPATDGTAIYMFDPVIKAAVSSTSPTGLGVPVPGCTSGPANLSPGTTLCLGVSLNYGALSALTYHYVIDEVEALFMGICSGATSITVASHVGKNSNFLFSTTGSTTTKLSGAQVNSATIDTTAGRDVRLLALSNLSPNAEGANAIVEVIFMKHFYAEGAAGI